MFSTILFNVSLLVICAFALDWLALVLIRRPGASRPCRQCDHCIEGPGELPLCRRATNEVLRWDPVAGHDTAILQRVTCEVERSGGVTNALARGLVFLRWPACSRYGLGFRKRGSGSSCG